jgi:hypothetical protein
LEKQGVFSENSKDTKVYFKNGLKIFEAIYGKGYEFNDCYVSKNLLLTKRRDIQKGE